jgi:hypothetical protein
MIAELWSNRTVISNHFSNKMNTIARGLGIGAHLGWLIIALLGLLLLYTLIRYYEWSRQPSTAPEVVEAFSPEDWPDMSNSEQAGPGQHIINYIQPGDHQCANLQAYISADYLIYMNQPNIQSRGFDTLAELSDQYRQGICQMITNDEQRATTKWIIAGLSKLKNPTWRKVAEKWLSASYLCKAQPWLEGGMPHTHGRAILMRPDWFSSKSQNNSKDIGALGILWHEITHIWQRFQPNDFTGLYREWGFSPISETPAGLETILIRSRLNPDALPAPSSPIWIWQPPTKKINEGVSGAAYWIGAVYPTLTPTTLHDIQFWAYTLAAGGTRYLGQQPVALQKLPEFTGFFGSGRNHYHPNELAAHYMDELLTGRADLDVQAIQIFANWLARSS